MKELKKLWISMFVFFPFLVMAQTSTVKVEVPTPEPLENYNFVLGTQGIGGKYKFTKDSYLVEQAKQIRGLGSNILKISVSKQYHKIYPDQFKDPNIKTTLDLVKIKQDFREVLDMDFKYIFMWVHTLTNAKWNDGITETEKKAFYNEMYDYTTYLLKRYNKSGKTFLIGNWEGDWLLHGMGNKKLVPSETKIAGMTEWFQIRQQAIDDAKRDTKHKNVEVYHYIEVNLALKGMKGEKCISESILPNVDVDFVSYSSYEISKRSQGYENVYKDVAPVMDYIESKLQPKEGLPFSRRVWIGEYGFKVVKGNFEEQAGRSKDVMLASIQMKLPFCLHWEMYNNEYEKNGESKDMSLISAEGEKKPIYFIHNDYFIQMNNYLKAYKKANKKYPTNDEFYTKAFDVLKTIEFNN
ncbi:MULTISPECIES: hypothetical protein [Flammeovirga]|uniref:Glycoside hydrolase family 5 domain-containing protein n=1 Tax=Flammeovirga agarivorans TaxID=2726742 RepID=A0A7X8SKD7_9BACT|nr:MULTISPECIES: hypothetical protein [Flammeovirga]NLR91752.1 hypothetical protein [Flammeovirga agarivorans]